MEMTLHYMPGSRAECVRWTVARQDSSRRTGREIVPFAEKRYAKAPGVLENAVKDQDYLIDGRFSAAGIMVGYILAWFPGQLVSFPGLKTCLARLKQRTAYPTRPEISADFSIPNYEGFDVQTHSLSPELY